MDRAWESNDPASIEEALLPQMSLHFISGSLLQAEPFLPYFSFIVVNTLCGSSSSPWTTNFCKEELILLQSWQQNHLPLGTSCSCISKHQYFNPIKGLHMWLTSIFWIKNDIQNTFRSSMSCSLKHPTWNSFSHWEQKTEKH